MQKFDLTDEQLGEMWDTFDFNRAEAFVRRKQKKLTLATFKKNKELMKKISLEITLSLPAKCLAVREVSEKLSPAVGVDGVRWITSAEKMRASFNLTSKDYKAKNYKRFIITDSKANKERRVNIPAMQDRAMQILCMYALSPISEATADRKSFAYRKGRSALDVHALIMSMLLEKNPPKFFVICDIKSYYDSISHAWLIKNIPMQKHILAEFLNAGIVFDNQLFPSEDVGISLGCNISTILANMTLDGIQNLLYDLQKDKEIDYYDGYAIRFADDILISARTFESANTFLKKVEEFIRERGLRFSDEKTYVTTIEKGFDFLSRHYYKKDGIIYCNPSEKAVNKLKDELLTLFNLQKRWSQKKLIDLINSKLNGWATYHRIEDSNKEFVYIDNYINALLLRLAKKMHPKSSIEILKKKYWYLDNKGRQVFALYNNKNIKIIKLEDVVLVKQQRLDTSKNIYLDEEYFKTRNVDQDIDKVSGKYKTIWQRQDGKCYFCDNPIKINQAKRLVIKDLTSKDNTIRNLAYVHDYCIASETTYINIDNQQSKSIDISSIIESINDFDILKIQTQNSKYSKLYEYFAKSEKSTFILKFSEIENIINTKLCKSLYNNEKSWFYKGKNLITNSWDKNGYKVKRVYINEKKVTFIRVKKSLSKVNIPEQLLSSNIPKSAKEELEQFFKYIIDKYGL